MHFVRGLAGALMLAVLVSASLGALSPTRSQHSWVAGTGEAGDTDGPFMVASFNRPEGILYDPSGDRLIAADNGNHALRVVSLGAKNATSTLQLRDSATGDRFDLVPSSLAWKRQGTLLYCLDLDRPGVAEVDLVKGTARWLPIPASFSVAGLGYSLANAQSVGSASGRFGVLSFNAASVLLLFDLSNGGSVLCRLSGVPGGSVDDLACEPDGIWGINRASGSLFRLQASLGFDACLRGFASTSSSAVVCSDLTADTQVGSAVKRPWSFVRGAADLEVACDAPAIMAYRNPHGTFNTWYMLDARGRKIGLENDNIYDEKQKLLYTLADPYYAVGSKRLFRRPAWTCEDSTDQRWYLSDTDSQRIVSMTRSDPDFPGTEVSYGGLMDTMFPTAKKSYVHRIGVISSCYFKEAKNTNRKADTFTKRLQWYLNAFSSLDNGSPYEIMFFGDTILHHQSYTGLIKDRMAQMVGKYHCDELILAMRPRDLQIIVHGYLNYPLDTDGLPVTSLDPEYMTRQRTWKDVEAAPLYESLARYVISHPQFQSLFQVGKGPGLDDRDAREAWSGNIARDYVNAEYLDKIFALWTHDLKVLKGEMDAMAASEGRPPLRIILLLVPEHSTTGPQETNTDDEGTGSLVLIREHFRDMCRTLGIHEMDLVDEMRVLSVDSPLLEVDDGHPTAAGADLMALVAARRYLETFPR